MKRTIIDSARSFLDREGLITAALISLAWWAGTDNPGDPFGGVVIVGLAFITVVVCETVAAWWRGRRRRPRRSEIGTIQQRPILTDYRRILLVPRETKALREIPGSFEVAAHADLILTEDDRSLKDRYGPASLVHPGLFAAAKLLPGIKALDLTDPYVCKRVQREVKAKPGRTDLWGFPLEVVRDGTGW